jgi:hypothetical protein
MGPAGEVSSLPQITQSATDEPQLRQRAQDIVEALLATLRQSGNEKVAANEDRVPLLRAVAPVQPGEQATAVMKVANEEDTPSTVTLYSSNFVADSGYDIPSLYVTPLPRRLTIPAKASAEFSVAIVVPKQTPAGTYSGLIQAMGCKYVKAVLSVEVL